MRKNGEREKKWWRGSWKENGRRARTYKYKMLGF